VSVNPDCLEVYQTLKLGKKLKYIVYSLNETNTEIVVEKQSESKEYEDFLTDLPETECRWAVYDFEFEKEGAGKRNKLCFLAWYIYSPARSY
jgi:cofilin